MGGQQSQEPLTSYTLPNGTTLVYDGDGNVVSAVAADGSASTPQGDSSPYAKQFEQLWQRGLQLFSGALGAEAQSRQLQSRAAADAADQRRILNYALLAAGIYAAVQVIKKLA